MDARAVTASVGVAVLGDGDTATPLVGQADAALYDAKAAGRNRVRVAEAQLVEQWQSTLAAV